MALQFPNSSSSSSSSSFSYKFTYHVFLSFRGTDTRYGFTGNLHKALTDKEIITFIDDRDLHGGDEITPSLFRAIKESRIAIPIFSINYASSPFCLDELVHIMECFKENNRLILPVFYHVDPSQVRHGIGSYGKALAEHKEEFEKNKDANNIKRLQKWKMTLNQIANLTGEHITLGRNEYEHKVIEKIVKEVSNKINRMPLYVADYPVGLQSRVLQVKSLLDAGSCDGKHMVGIYGTGGMGKSTLARATYNCIADQFECLCFLDDVREKSAQHGLVYLQENILYETIREKDIKLGSVNKGIPIIKERLHRKKVLLVLDDVDKLKQLQVLAGALDWFGHGSKVIITTRDKHLLASHGIEKTYEVEELNKEEALDLLRWKAFRNNNVDSSFEDIINRVVTYASGLPLALEVVGSNLYGKNIEEWEFTLDRYKRIPHNEIRKILEVSFDSLEEDVQSVFLDIACCLKGYKLEEVEDILCAHYGQCMKYHIGMLVEKSLVKINHYLWSRNYVTLHDLIMDMGKEIVRRESPKKPGKRSRLWFYKDIIQVLEENSGTSNIEIISLDCPLAEEVVDWNGKAFKMMRNLKTLIVKHGHFSKSPSHLPNSLRVLKWQKYPSKCLPSNFHPKKLVICNLSASCFTSSILTSIFNKRYLNMKDLSFNHCEYLTHIPDISTLPNLEIFSFENCENLITIHDSVGFLDKLKILDARGCSKIKSFPPLKLTSLEELRLSSCESLKIFPEILGVMENITSIVLHNSSIEELPFSFQNLTRLHTLEIWGSRMLGLTSSLRMMPKSSDICAPSFLFPGQNDKQELLLTQCNPADDFLPIILTRFANVINLDLSRNNFTIIPKCIEECRFLRSLLLDDCKHLREIGGIPQNLKILHALRCESLTSTCRNMLLNQELHVAGGTEFCFSSGTESIPEWFDHESRGPSISFWFRNNLPSIALFFVTKWMPNKCRHSEDSLELTLFIDDYNCVLDNSCSYRLGLYCIQPDVTYIFDLQLQDLVCYPKIKSKLDRAFLKNKWIHAELRFKGPMTESVLIESGIHVSKQKSSMEDIQFTDPYRKRKFDDESDVSSPDDDDHETDDGDEEVNKKLLECAELLTKMKTHLLEQGISMDDVLHTNPYKLRKLDITKSHHHNNSRR